MKRLLRQLLRRLRAALCVLAGRELQYGPVGYDQRGATRGIYCAGRQILSAYEWRADP